ADMTVKMVVPTLGRREGKAGVVGLMSMEGEKRKGQPVWREVQDKKGRWRLRDKREQLSIL
ncbi:MAG TPA: hypothetical protein PKV30_05460, partial [Ottowia sp.]|nr:hypothetical protein [Ottowia sp.]